MALPVAIAEPVEQAVKKKRLRQRRYRGYAHAVWWFVLPAAALYLFAVVVPSVQGGIFAFTDWDGISADSEWVGLKQFKAIFTDSNGSTAVKNTLLIAVVVTIVQNVLGLLIALGVNTKIKTRNVLRVLIFAPVVITSIAVGFLWQNLLAPDGGINQGLEGVGLGGLRQNWLGDPDVALFAIMIVVIWQFVGYSMVIFLAGLQGIPPEILEAAAIDGAGPFRRFWYIIRPMLAPAITINVMLSLIGGFKLFDQVFVMTQGGPGGATNTISTLIYTNAFQLQRFAYGAALAIVLTIFVAIASGIQYKLLARQGR
jgi:raffinose/stachyose/melibiose transport system permease protein